MIVVCTDHLGPINPCIVTIATPVTQPSGTVNLVVVCQVNLTHVDFFELLVFNMESKAFDLFHREEFLGARTLLETLLKSARDDETKSRYLFNIASCSASLGEYESARESFVATGLDGNDLLYNRALCEFRLGNYEETLELIGQLLTNCETLYPELIVQQNEMSHLDDERLETSLQESRIVEAQNLRAATILQLDEDLCQVKQCLDDLPIKREDLLDCITLHNKAIYEHQENLESAISKLDYLSKFWTNSKDQPELAAQLPRETFRNLLILYSMRDNPDSSATLDLLESDRSQIESNMSKEEMQFFDIYFSATVASSSDELTYRKLDRLVSRILDIFDTITSENEREHYIELLMVVLTHEGKVLWHNGQYNIIEKLLLSVGSRVKQVEGNLYYISNLAHTLFMTDNKFDECAKLYEDLLTMHTNSGQSLAGIDPQVLSSLCVAYVLTGRNNDAEALIKEVEISEETTGNERAFSTVSAGYHDNGCKLSALCCINLVIGTLYCVKYNYGFGLTRMLKSLVPLEHNLNMLTWFYTKRCILSLLDCQCKQMICVKDDLLDQVIAFLIQCERVGSSIETVDLQCKLNFPTDRKASSFQGRRRRNTVTYEAKYLRSIVLTIIHD